jgi:hypothetical protein
MVRVRSKEKRRIGPEERLVVMRTVEAKPQMGASPNCVRRPETQASPFAGLAASAAAP